MAKVTVLGSGGFGVALSLLSERLGHQVTLWSAFEEEIALLKKDREHKKLLPGIAIPPSIVLTADMDCLKEAQLVIFAVPSFVVRKVAAQAKPYLNGQALVVNVAKGLEEGSLLRLSQVLEEELPNTVVALSGPSHAEEVGRQIPTTVGVSSRDIRAAEQVQEMLMDKSFRIYTNSDLVGVEMGATVKNAIALAAGICDGMGLGDNTKAALITRGISEMARLGLKMGGRSETFAGLSGIGDLIVTCNSMHSRNRRAGILIGQGISAAEAVKQVGTVEGYFATKLVYELAQANQVNMPIISECYQVCYHDKPPRQAIADLMSRPRTHEMEHNWLKEQQRKDDETWFSARS